MLVVMTIDGADHFMQTTQSSQSVDHSVEIMETEREHIQRPTGGKWWRRKLRRGLAGQSLAEFAISLPFLFFLMLALTELGFLIRDHLTVNYAAREGTRSGTQAGDYSPDYSIWDTRVGPGNDGDTVLVANVSSALQDKLDEAYLLMTYRADNSENGWFGLVTKPGERWGVFYADQPKEDTTDAGKNGEPRFFPSTNPYQRIFQPITTTLMVTVSGQSVDSKGVTATRTVVVPYVRKGWLPGVMDGGIYTYTISLPYKFATNTTPAVFASPTITTQSDPLKVTKVIGIVPPGSDPFATTSNQLQVIRSTNPCPITEPAQYSASKYLHKGVALAATIPSATTGFCGSNDPRNHLTQTATGKIDPDSLGDPYAGPYPPATLQSYQQVFTNSFNKDPWYPLWRVPGGFCDVQKPTTVVGTGSYFNRTGSTPNWLGVRIDYKHFYLTGWFGLPSLSLSDKAVKIMEPVPRPSVDWKCGLG